MGGDIGPAVTVPASLEALRLYSHLSLFLVGCDELITPFLQVEEPCLLNRLEIISPKTVVASVGEVAHSANRDDGAIRVMLELVKKGSAHGCVSAGNTKQIMIAATRLLKPSNAVARPALMALLPQLNRTKTVVLDLGANTHCSSVMLVQFAVMGTIVAENMLGIKHPRIAILNIGSEFGKGTECVRQAASMLNNMNNLNFVGYLEGSELLAGKVDVLVCDGFTGNIALKTLEGGVNMLISSLLAQLSAAKYCPISFTRWYVKRRLTIWRQLFHPDRYNGAHLLGLREVVVKSHGAANQPAFLAAIGQAEYAVRRQIARCIAINFDAMFGQVSR